MYTPYNMFYPELPKAQGGGDKVPPDNVTTTVPEGELPIGSIVDYGGKKGIVTGYTSDGTQKLKAIANDDPILLKGKYGDYSSNYIELENALNDPEVKEALWKEYQKDSKYYKITDSGKIYKNVKNADELIKRFLKTQKAIMILNANTSEEEFTSLNLDSSKDNRNKILADYGIDDTDLAAFQKSFFDLKDIAQDRSISKNVKTKLDNFNWEGSGPIDDDSASISDRKGVGNLSYVDVVFGNNTSRQMATTKQKQPVDIPITEKTKEPVNFITGAKLQQPPLPRRQPKFWKQDIISMINAGMDWASIKQLFPWFKPVDLEEPRYALVDPTWSLQQNAGLLNQQIEGLGAFGDSRSYVTNLSGMAGKASDQSKDILSRYDERNALIQNDAEARKTAIRNQEEMLNTQAAIDNYDKTMISEQNTRNANTITKTAMAEAYKNALNNRGLTQAQNLMSAPFQVLPETGGYVMFDPRLANEMVPSQSDEKIKEQRLDYILSQEKYKGQDLESIYRMLYGDETLGYPVGRQPRRRQQQYRPTYQEMMMMYPGATGGNPYGYIG